MKIIKEKNYSLISSIYINLCVFLFIYILKLIIVNLNDHYLLVFDNYYHNYNI